MEETMPTGEVDYSEQLNTSIELLTEMNTNISLISSSLLSYAIIFVPLVFIIIGLWWFFKQFIR